MAQIPKTEVALIFKVNAPNFKLDHDAWNIKFAAPAELRAMRTVLACKAALERFSNKVDARVSRGQTPSVNSEMVEQQRVTIKTIGAALSRRALGVPRVQRMVRAMKEER